MYIAMEASWAVDGEFYYVDVFVPKREELLNMIKQAKETMSELGQKYPQTIENAESLSITIPLKGAYVFYINDLPEAYGEGLGDSALTVADIPKTNAKFGTKVYLRVWQDSDDVTIIAIDPEDESCEYTQRVTSEQLHNDVPVDIEAEYAVDV